MGNEQSGPTPDTRRQRQKEIEQRFGEFYRSHGDVFTATTIEYIKNEAEDWAFDVQCKARGIRALVSDSGRIEIRSMERMERLTENSESNEATSETREIAEESFESVESDVEAESMTKEKSTTEDESKAKDESEAKQVESEAKQVECEAKQVESEAKDESFAFARQFKVEMASRFDRFVAAQFGEIEVLPEVSSFVLLLCRGSDVRVFAVESILNRDANDVAFVEPLLSLVLPVSVGDISSLKLMRKRECSSSRFCWLGTQQGALLGLDLLERRVCLHVPDVFAEGIDLIEYDMRNEACLDIVVTERDTNKLAHVRVDADGERLRRAVLTFPADGAVTDGDSDDGDSDGDSDALSHEYGVAKLAFLAARNAQMAARSFGAEFAQFALSDFAEDSTNVPTRIVGRPCEEDSRKVLEQQAETVVARPKVDDASFRALQRTRERRAQLAASLEVSRLTQADFDATAQFGDGEEACGTCAVVLDDTEVRFVSSERRCRRMPSQWLQHHQNRTITSVRVCRNFVAVLDCAGAFSVTQFLESSATVLVSENFGADLSPTCMTVSPMSFSTHVEDGAYFFYIAVAGKLMVWLLGHHGAEPLQKAVPSPFHDAESLEFDGDVRLCETVSLTTGHVVRNFDSSDFARSALLLVTDRSVALVSLPPLQSFVTLSHVPVGSLRFSGNLRAGDGVSGASDGPSGHNDHSQLHVLAATVFAIDDGTFVLLVFASGHCVVLTLCDLTLVHEFALPQFASPPLHLSVAADVRSLVLRCRNDMEHCYRIKMRRHACSSDVFTLPQQPLRSPEEAPATVPSDSRNGKDTKNPKQKKRSVWGAIKRTLTSHASHSDADSVLQRLATCDLSEHVPLRVPTDHVTTDHVTTDDVTTDHVTSDRGVGTSLSDLHVEYTPPEPTRRDRRQQRDLAHTQQRLHETRQLMQQRGQRMSRLADRTQETAERAEEYQSLTKQLLEQQKSKGFFGF